MEDFPLFSAKITLCEAPRPKAGASRARSGESKASKGNIVLIVPLDPTHKAGLAGHLPANSTQRAPFS